MPSTPSSDCPTSSPASVQLRPPDSSVSPSPPSHRRFSSEDFVGSNFTAAETASSHGMLFNSGRYPNSSTPSPTLRCTASPLIGSATLGTPDTMLEQILSPAPQAFYEYIGSKFNDRHGPNRVAQVRGQTESAQLADTHFSIETNVWHHVRRALITIDSF